MNKDETAGLKKLKERIDEKEIMVVITDKSNKMSVTTPNIYKESMKCHTEKDLKTDMKGANKIAKTLNEHSKDFVKILNIGESHGQNKRAIRNATVHKDGEIPLLVGAFKDHKDTKEGIKMRPIMNAMSGPKRALSDMFSDVLEQVLDINNDEIWCKSTKELLHAIESYNKETKSKTLTNNEKEKKIVGSMDVITLYPSIEAERAAEIVVAEVTDSEANFVGLNTQELSKFIRKNMNQKQIDEKGFTDILPIKKKSNVKTRKQKHVSNDDPDDNDVDDVVDDDMHESLINLFDSNGGEPLRANSLDQTNENESVTCEEESLANSGVYKQREEGNVENKSCHGDAGEDKSPN